MRVAAVLVALVAVLALPRGAAAQPLCQPGAFHQEDMAGVYESWESQMRLTVYPCGGTHLLWSNWTGTHEAGYVGSEHLPGGGVVARVAIPDPLVRSLDNRNVMAYKPAEAGMIQIITVGPFGEDGKVYRLAKV